MKIIFFDIKDYEKDFFIENLNYENYSVKFIAKPLLGVTNIEREWKDADIISIFPSSRLDKEVLSKFKNLKLICTRSVGFSHIDTDYCKAKNIQIATTAHYGDNTVAEFSFALLLDLVKHTSSALHNMRYGEQNAVYTGEELFGKTIGIIGTGAIGSKSVRIAKGFGMKILASDIVQNEDLIKNYDVKYTDIESLCKKSDVIMLHAPLTKDNFHLINDKMFNIMKKNCFLINTARGELVDTLALYNALIYEKIKGAGLDVVECEELFTPVNEYIENMNNCSICIKKTLINHLLLNLKNVIITPHIAYDTKEATTRILEKTFQNISEFLEGKTITNLLYLQ